MRVSELRVHPLKSAAGQRVPSAVVEPWGLRGDRRWAVVRADGELLRTRDLPRMLSVAARPLAHGGLAVTVPGLPELAIAVPDDGEPLRVDFSGLDYAIQAAEDANGRFSQLLGRPVRLVWLDDPGRRAMVPADGGHPGDVVSFGTGPLLLTSRTSLRQLNDWITEEALEGQEEVPEPLSMVRFRPSVVIDDAAPFVEDSWEKVRIGQTEFRVSELCDRCVVTTFHPDTQAQGKEPLRTLAKHRRWDGSMWFGIRLVPLTTGEISIGDPIVPLA